ncbi:MAG: hypothetical protein V4480_01925 [Patescibacteria group bacterium]
MLYSARRSLEDRVTELVMSGPTSIKKLHAQLQAVDSPLSLRAVYKAANQLVDSGVLLKAGKILRINEEWARAIRKHLAPVVSLKLAAGERMTHSFTSIAHLDAFWTTIAFQLEELEKDGQIFFYNPHNFWAYIPERREQENAYYSHFTDSKLHAFFTLGGESAADLEFKRSHQNQYLQIDTRNIPSLPRTDHITIMGDFIITVRIPKVLSARIDELYSSGNSISELLPILIKLYRTTFSSRFVLEHNPTKAKKLKKMLSTNFYFPR